MADTNEKVILRVEIDQSEAVQRSAQLSKEIKDLTTANKELAKAGKDTTAEYQENLRLTKMLKDEKAQLDRQIDLSIKAFSAESGSINQLRAEVSFLTMKYNDLSESERDNTETGKQLQASIKAKTDRLKELEGAVGDNRRSVGDYRGALRDVVGEMQNLNSPLGNTINNLVSFKETIDNSREAIKGAGVNFQSFNGILKASVIGIIIVGLASLYTLFTKFQPMVDKVEQAMSGLNAAFDVLVSRLIVVGKGYLEVVIGYFEGLYNTGSAVIKLFKGDFSGAMDTMKNSFNRLADGIVQIKNGFNGMASEMADAAKEAAELTARLQDLGDVKLAQRLIDSDTSKQVSQLLLQARNRNLSEEQRLKKLEEANRLERKAFEGRKKIAEEEYNLAVEVFMNKSKLSKKDIDNLLRNDKNREEIEKRAKQFNDADLEGIAKLYEQKNSIEEESVALQEKIANRRAQLQQEIQADRDKALQKEAARLAKELELQAKLIEEQAKLKEDERKAKEEAFKADLAQAKQLNEALNLADKERLLAGELNEQEVLDRRIARELQFLEVQKGISQTYGQSTLELEQQIADKKIDIRKQGAERERQIELTKLQLNQQMVQEGANLVAAAASLASEATEAQKAVALTQLGVNLGTALSNILATSSSPTPDNLVTGGVSGFVKYLGFFAQVLSAMAQARGIISAAAGGGSFMTTGPTLLMVGDNPGGRERIDVTPLSGRGQTYVSPNSGLIKMAGGGSIITGDGGYSARRTKGSLIDYNELAAAMAKYQVKVDIVEVSRSLDDRKATIAKASL